MRQRFAIALLAVLLATAGASAHANALSTTAPSLVKHASCASAPSTAGTQAVHHAGLVIVFGEDRVETLCIEFTEDEISGAELLRRSGLPVVLTGFGGLGTGVCRIDDVGCSDPSDCFCQCRGAECSYWAYYAVEEDAWRYLPVGASQRRLHDGDADGWVWGSGHERPTASSVCPTVAPTSPTPTRRHPAPGVSASTATPATGGGITVAQPTVPADATPGSGATATVGTTPQVRREDGTGPNDGQDVETPEDGSRRRPTGLIVFGAVAGAVVAVIVGLIVRRRLLG